MGPVRDAIKRFIVETFFVTEEAISDTGSLIQAGIIDSTGVLEVIAFLEQSFGIKIHDSELLPENLDTLDAMVALVGRKATVAA